MHTYQPSLQHVKLGVRFSSKKGKKEKISIFTKDERLVGRWEGAEQGQESC